MKERNLSNSKEEEKKADRSFHPQKKVPVKPGDTAQTEKSGKDKKVLGNKAESNPSRSDSFQYSVTDCGLEREFGIGYFRDTSIRYTSERNHSTVTSAYIQHHKTKIFRDTSKLYTNKRNDINATNANIQHQRIKFFRNILVLYINKKNLIDATNAMYTSERNPINVTSAIVQLYCTSLAASVLKPLVKSST